MKQKKALMLAETTVRIFIAVICILILIYFGTVLYKIFKEKSKIEEAKSHLDNIIRLGNGAKEGEYTPYLILNPVEWHLLTFPGENKLCFCPIKTAWIWKKIDWDYWREACKQGVCENSPSPITFDMRYYDSEGKRIWTEYGLLVFDPRTIYISKESDGIFIRDYNKKEFMPIVEEILSLDLRKDNLEKDIEEKIEGFENEMNRKFAVIIEYKEEKELKFIPENPIKKVGRNFVVSGDKKQGEENIAVYLLVKRDETKYE